MQSALRGVFCVAKSPGSTAEARGRAGLRNNAKSQRQISSWHLLFLDIHVSPYECKRPAHGGSVGDSYDNALAETINGLYKAEVIHRLGPWKTMAAVEWETLKWVDWFNNRRLLGPIGYIPPAEAEERYYAQFDTLDMVA